MNTFIKKYQYNYIKKCLINLNRAFKSSIDENIIEATKVHLNDKILSVFEGLSEDEKDIIDITKIEYPLHIDAFLLNLDKYVFGMESVTKPELVKLFKKEKKLHLPDQETFNSKNVYLGWIDTSTRKMLIAYKINGRLLGMICRIVSQKNSSSHVCAICNHVGKDNEVISVSSLCKTSGSANGAYRSIGFTICKNSDDCNERISSVEKLENILKKVNNIK